MSKLEDDQMQEPIRVTMTKSHSLSQRLLGNKKTCHHFGEESYWSYLGGHLERVVRENLTNLKFLKVERDCGNQAASGPTGSYSIEVSSQLPRDEMSFSLFLRDVEARKTASGLYFYYWPNQ